MPTIKWGDRDITITHSKPSYAAPFEHIEVRCSEILPITETGYRSHFIHRDELALWASPVDFMTEWLEKASQDPAWREKEFNSKQGELF